MAKEIKKKLSKKVDSLTQDWIITIPNEVIENGIKDELVKIQKDVKMDGYRQGHAPIEEIDKKYGENAFYRALNTAIRTSINEILADEKIKLAIQPEVDLEGQPKRGDKEIEAKVRIVKKPELPKINYEKIALDVVELELSEQDKKDELDRFAERMAKAVELKKQRAVKKGDIVDINFTGRTAKDNVEFEGGQAKGYKLEIGSKSFIDGFEDQIIGHNKGDKFDVKVQFPKEYHAQNLAGQDAIFAIELNEIFEKEKPELNDEFAKSLGFESMEKIKELLFKNLKDVYEGQMKNMLKNKLFDGIVEKYKFDLPESIIEKEVEDRLANEKERNKDNKNWKEKDVRKKIEEGLHKSYASFYLTDGVATENAIEVSDQEIEQTAMQDAIRGGMNVNEVLENLKKDDRMKNYIGFAIKEAKVFDFMFDKIKKNTTTLDKKGYEKFLEVERKKLEEGK